MQEGQQLSVCNRGLQAQLHAVKVRKIALRRAFFVQRRQLASLTTQIKHDKAQHQVTLLHCCTYSEMQESCCHVSHLCMLLHYVQSSVVTVVCTS